MMSLIIVVLAIILSAILVAGGASYLHVGIMGSLVASSDFRAGKDAIMVAVSSYKMTHDGALPRTASRNDFVAAIKKYMPKETFATRMPPGAQDFIWTPSELSDGRFAVCLENQTKSGSINAAIIENVLTFARKEALQARSPDVELSNSCSDRTGATSDPAMMDKNQLSGDSSIAVSFALE